MSRSEMSIKKRVGSVRWTGEKVWGVRGAGKKSGRK